MAASRPDSIARASNQAMACLVPVSVAAGKRVSPQRFQCSKSCFAAVFDHAFIAMSVIFQRESRIATTLNGESLSQELRLQTTIAGFPFRSTQRLHNANSPCRNRRPS